jgi:hypothetical protein
MTRHYFAVASLCCFALGCTTRHSTAGLDFADTGLEGVVRRGPIMPVCRDGEPCDAPFSASFAIRDGQKIVARFRSDSTGHFVVTVAAGDYMVVPDSSAPLLGASYQTRPVTVGPHGLTHVELEFDTGIR